ncbi:putative carboxylesterase 15, partial [Zea mays]
MSGSTAPPHVVEDFLGVIQIFSDGSIVRGDESTIMPAGPCPDVPGVQWKDAVYEATRGLKVRVYKPPPTPGGGNQGKLPVLVYFYGGGYCGGAYDHPLFHSCCQRFAAELPAVVLSVQYRLAPEHRLPAAVEDGAAFFSWLRAQAQAQPAAPGAADPWLAESADFSRTFVSGGSAGANLAHHILWRMALPVGAIRDHPLANPFGPGSPSLEPLPLPPALVVAPERDVLHGHVWRYAARLREMGKPVELAEFAGEGHGFS